MRVAALYDVHGNLPALEAVLAEALAAGVDEVVVGGDVLPGPLPVECLDRLAALTVPVRYLRGNGDRVTLQAAAGLPVDEVPAAHREPIHWCAGQLDAAHRQAVASWPATQRWHQPALGRVLFCHATPHDDTTVFTARTPEPRLARLLDGAEADLVVCGHTHMQFDRTVGAVRVVNAGSVGMAFAPPAACWLLLGDEVELRRTPYDREAAARRIAASSYPGAAAFAERFVLSPPEAEPVLASYARFDVD